MNNRKKYKSHRRWRRLREHPNELASWMHALKNTRMYFLIEIYKGDKNERNL